MATVVFSDSFENSPTFLNANFMDGGEDDYDFDWAMQPYGGSFYVNNQPHLAGGLGAHDGDYLYRDSTVSDTPSSSSWATGAWHIMDYADVDPVPVSADRPFSQRVEVGDTIDVSVQMAIPDLFNEDPEGAIRIDEFTTAGVFVETFIYDITEGAGGYTPVTWQELTAAHTVENNGYVTVGFAYRIENGSLPYGFYYDSFSVTYTLAEEVTTLYFVNRGFRFPYMRWT